MRLQTQWQIDGFCDTHECIDRSRYEWAARVDRTLVAAYDNRGNVLKQMGAIEAALLAFREGIRVDPRRAHTYFNMGSRIMMLFGFKMINFV